MTSTRKITAAVALTGALIAAPAIAETAAPSSTTSASSSGAAKSTTDQARTPVTLRLDAKGKIDQGALPKDSTLFTVDELRSIVPGLQSANFTDGALNLVIKDEATDNRSKIVIYLKRFGKKNDVTKAWDSEKKAHEARAAKNPGLYTFTGTGSNSGVAGSFSDGTTTHVLLTNGDVAGEIWFSGIGFSSLGDDHAAARKAYRDDIVPKLTKLLGDKVRAGGPAKAPEKKSSSSSSPTTSGSSKPSSSSSDAKA